MILDCVMFHVLAGLTRNSWSRVFWIGAPVMTAPERARARARATTRPRRGGTDARCDGWAHGLLLLTRAGTVRPAFGLGGVYGTVIRQR
eukprot:COSAG02_NODE_6553_length_3500_cov_1.405763_1_plen_89_part_00